MGRTAEKNEAARIAAIGNIKTAAELQAEQEEAKFKIALAGVGGTLVSSLFFYENLRRLYIKFSSGGRDSGYGTAADNNYRRSKVNRRRNRSSPSCWAFDSKAGEGVTVQFGES